METAAHWLRSIEDVKDDPERAHEWQDRFYEWALCVIALGECDDPRAVAAEALKARDIKFPRWCA